MYAEPSSICAGHMHPAFFAIMDEIQDGLRYMFQTKSKYVCLISGTGHSGGITCQLYNTVITCCSGMSEYVW